MSTPSKYQGMMKDFWNARAKEHAPFYIATWRGYERKGTDDFYLNRQDVEPFLTEAEYAPTGNERMLEIGCGIGRMSHGFAQCFEEVHAIDVSGEMVAQAKSQLGAIKQLHFYENNGVDLSLFQDDFFDFCFSFIVFQHIPDKAVTFSYIREAGRVLKPGGTFHFQVMNLPNLDLHANPTVLLAKRVYRQLIRRPLLTLWRNLRGGPRGFESPAWGGSSVTVAEVRQACTAGNLDITKIRGEGTAYMWVTARKRA